MYLQIYDDHKQMSLAAAQIVAGILREKNPAILGLATGSTPLAMYAELVRLHREEGLSFAAALTFNLDEYVGLAVDAPQSYHSYMRENLFAHVDIAKERTFIPDGAAADPYLAAAEYAALLKRYGPLHLQILGIGSNGHIGFNEPGSPWDTSAGVLQLAEETRRDNARFFGGDLKQVPQQAITISVAEICAAQRVLLLASGRAKAEIIRAALYGPQSEAVPASALQRHPNLHVLLDREAAHLL